MPHYYDKKQTSQLHIQRLDTEIRDNRLSLYSASGVFGKSCIDAGSLLLAEEATIKKGWKVLDLGAGYGPIGIAIAKAFPTCKVLLSDVNKRAVMLSKKNIALNKLKNVSAIQSDVFENITEKFDSILCNPPQSAGREICFKMIAESKKHLVKGGLFQMVARHNIGGKVLEEQAEKVFGNVTQSAVSFGFRVYVSECISDSDIHEEEREETKIN